MKSSVLASAAPLAAESAERTLGERSDARGEASGVASADAPGAGRPPAGGRGGSTRASTSMRSKNRCARARASGAAAAARGSPGPGGSAPCQCPSSRAMSAACAPRAVRRELLVHALHLGRHERDRARVLGAPAPC